jgi:hypothetical protein
MPELQARPGRAQRQSAGQGRIGLSAAFGATLALGLIATSADAQSPDIPTPSEFHGYELGTRYTITSRLYDYYRTLAQRSPRVEYTEYGRSLQGRPLPMVVVSSEANLTRLDQIRSNLRRRVH